MSVKRWRALDRPQSHNCIWNVDSMRLTGVLTSVSDTQVYSLQYLTHRCTYFSICFIGVLTSVFDPQVYLLQYLTHRCTHFSISPTGVLTLASDRQVNTTSEYTIQRCIGYLLNWLTYLDTEMRKQNLVLCQYNAGIYQPNSFSIEKTKTEHIKDKTTTCCTYLLPSRIKKTAQYVREKIKIKCLTIK